MTMLQGFSITVGSIFAFSALGAVFAAFCMREPDWQKMVIGQQAWRDRLLQVAFVWCAAISIMSLFILVGCGIAWWENL